MQWLQWAQVCFMRRCRYGRLGKIMFSGIRKAPTLGLGRCIVRRLRTFGKVQRETLEQHWYLYHSIWWSYVNLCIYRMKRSMNIVSCQSIWVNEPTVAEFGKKFFQVASGDSSGSASSSPEKFHSEPDSTKPYLYYLN